MIEKQLALAANFARLVKAGDPRLGELLHANVAYYNLGQDLDGRAAVLEHLLGDVSGCLYREAEWQVPVMHHGAVQITAHLTASAQFDNKIITLHLDAAQVVKIEEQILLPIRPPIQTSLKIGEDLKAMINSALASRSPMLLAHVDEDGQPVVSFRGSVHALDDDRLALWVRNANGRLMRAIAANPKVALMYRNEDRRASFQFQGRARIAEGEADRQGVFAAIPQVEQDHDFARLGVAVIIELDRIEGYAGVAGGRVVGAVNMRREAGRPVST